MRCRTGEVRLERQPVVDIRGGRGKDRRGRRAVQAEGRARYQDRYRTNRKLILQWDKH